MKIVRLQRLRCGIASFFNPHKRLNFQAQSHQLRFFLVLTLQDRDPSEIPTIYHVKHLHGLVGKFTTESTIYFMGTIEMVSGPEIFPKNPLWNIGTQAFFFCTSLRIICKAGNLGQSGRWPWAFGFVMISPKEGWVPGWGLNPRILVNEDAHRGRSTL